MSPDISGVREPTIIEIVGKEGFRLTDYRVKGPIISGARKPTILWGFGRHRYYYWAVGQSHTTFLDWLQFRRDFVSGNWTQAGLEAQSHEPLLAQWYPVPPFRV